MSMHPLSKLIEVLNDLDDCYVDVPGYIMDGIINYLDEYKCCAFCKNKGQHDGCLEGDHSQGCTQRAAGAGIAAASEGLNGLLRARGNDASRSMGAGVGFPRQQRPAYSCMRERGCESIKRGGTAGMMKLSSCPGITKLMRDRASLFYRQLSRQQNERRHKDV